MFYAFNITNVEAVIMGLEKPKLKEVGPYTYVYHTITADLKSFDNGTKVSYTEVNSYDYVPEKSVAATDDVVDLYVFNQAYVALISKFAAALNVAGEGEIQMAMPSLVYENMLKMSPVPDMTAAAWGADPWQLDAAMAAAGGLPALPFYLSFAAFTFNVTKTNLVIPPANASNILNMLRFGTTGKNAANLITISSTLKAVTQCLKTSPPCGTLPALLAVLASYKEPVLYDLKYIPDLAAYFHQITYDVDMARGRVGALAMMTFKNGWFHRTFTKVSPKEVWFRNQDPLWRALQGADYPGAFQNWHNTTAAMEYYAANKMDKESIQHTGKGDWRKRGFYEKDFGNTGVDYWNHKFNISKALARYTPEISYSYNNVPKEPLSTSLWIDLIKRDVSFIRGGTEKVKGVEMRKYYLNQDVIRIDDAFNNDISGFINMSPVYSGVATYYSAPHFSYTFNNSMWYQDRVEGMVKDESPIPTADTKHTSVLFFEPITGLMLKGYRRLQINMLVNNNGGVHFPVSYPNLNNSVNGTMFPIFWADQNGELTDSQASDIKNLIYAPIKMRLGLCIVFWLLGPVSLVVAVFFFYKHKKTTNCEKYASNDDSDSDEPQSPDHLLSKQPVTCSDRPSCPVIPFKGEPTLATFSPVDVEMQPKSDMPGTVNLP
eukprot:TRINITY_DN14257_c0_g1_i1.p1 TRINITY_DN14257_c0_g1~~TRINITY_DN14257_c0_g1_i1.p1  ORF type:complete len:739 (+),score=201.89 TRINITY_DN14257_c0_g1_i1:243-2219(+)